MEFGFWGYGFEVRGLGFYEARQVTHGWEGEGDGQGGREVRVREGANQREI